MDFVIIFIVLMLAIFAFVGWIVYWAISHSAKKNTKPSLRAWLSI